MDAVVPIRRALLSVSDKRGLLELARALADRGVHLLASGATRAALAEAGIAVTEVSAYTGQPEILGGRVKTLHPKLHGGILARRDVPDDLAALDAQGIEPIDLVVVNLYPFEATVAKPGVSFEEAVENIDVGGPSLIRGAAKNHAFVAVLVDPDQYPALLEQLETQGGTTADFRRGLAATVFDRTASYDRAIADYLARVTRPGEPFPPSIAPRFDRRAVLRYGENPHQRAAFYAEPGTPGPNLATGSIIHGKELSYNNLLDLDAALRLVRQFAEPAACALAAWGSDQVVDDLTTAPNGGGLLLCQLFQSAGIAIQEAHNQPSLVDRDPGSSSLGIQGRQVAHPVAGDVLPRRQARRPASALVAVEEEFETVGIG